MSHISRIIGRSRIIGLCDSARQISAMQLANNKLSNRSKITLNMDKCANDNSINPIDGESGISVYTQQRYCVLDD